MNIKTHPFVDYSRINFLNPQAERVFHQRIDPITDFHELRTLHLGDDLSRYGKQIARYHYNEPVEQVWEGYTGQALHKIWPGPQVQYLFAYSKVHGRPYYPRDEQAPGIHEGLQIFCLLNLAGPIGVVGMEVMELNHEEFRIALAYIEGGIYRGIQYLDMVELVQGGTQIVHTSYYKSERILGRLLPYKFFHNRTSNEFHNTVRSVITQTNYSQS